LNNIKENLIIGESPLILKLREEISKVSINPTSVLILGQTGTGKELVAKEVHRQSGVKGEYTAINCAAIPSQLLESELFGHEKGSFTGADRTRKGRFEQAKNGTLFLDEIGDMPLDLQAKLLRVLEDKTYQRIGGQVNLEVSARLIFATHQDIKKQVDTGKFRADLYYRINVFPIHTPNLSERSEDIPILIDHLLSEITNRLKVKKIGINEDAVNLLKDYPWPGNVRELRNYLERLLILSGDQDITSEIVSELIGNSHSINKVEEAEALWNATTPLEEEKDTNDVEYSDLLATKEFSLKNYLIEIEQKIIGMAMKKTNGSVAGAARALGLQRTTLIEKIKKMEP
tara:strand:+ start:1876 stop:2907 length:1032 start_codon:yes stop_codon:yes gene_type:complete